MKKVPIKMEEEEQRDRADKQQSEHSSELMDEPQELNFVPKMKRKQAMFITYRGLIQSATFQYSHSLTLMYTTVISQNWKLSNGEKSGISQNASHNGNLLVWNFPFQMTFQTKNPQGWPQLVVVIYGTDFFGRSVAKGYGNMHLPIHAGSHVRKLRIFDTIPQSNTANCCAYMMGYINELKQPQKVLTDKEGGRQFLQTRSIGEIVVKVEVRRYNFQNYGYQ